MINFEIEIYFHKNYIKITYYKTNKYFLQNYKNKIINSSIKESVLKL
jgi:hypothetical protein